MTFARASVRELPSPTRLLAAGIAALLLFALVRFVAGDGPPPLMFTLLTAGLQVFALSMFDSRRDPAASFLRFGFHLGTFAFFGFYPLMAPEEAGIGISQMTVTTVGWIIFLSVLGFEVAYWGLRLSRNSGPHRATDFALTEHHEKVLHWLLYLGLAAWFFTIADYAFSAGVPIMDVLLTMRGHIQGQKFEFATMLSGRLVILKVVLAAGLFLAATAASVLLIAARPQGRWLSLAAWCTLFVCSAAGFLGGSRSAFFYAFIPLLVTCWLRLSRSKLQSTRWLWAGGAAAVVLVAWGAMSAMRGADIRKFEGGLDTFDPMVHAKGALDIYSQMGVVVQSFPDVFDYQYGKSLIPLVLGWVPRAAWPTKPYPFGIYMNILNGETLENRSASIAVGLPGEGYGNFGLFGVFLWAAILGFACRRGDDYVGNFHPDHPLRLQIAAMAAIWIAMIVRGGVPEMFYQGLQILLLPWTLAMYLFRAEKAINYTLPVYSPTRPLLDKRGPMAVRSR